MLLLCVGIVISWVFLIRNKKWRESILSFISSAIIITAFTFISAIMALYGPLTDDFGKNHPIPEGQDYSIPYDKAYVLGNDGIRRYGLATTLYYIGELDEAGYPILHKNEGKILTVECTDDTFIWNKNGYQSSDQGSATMMMFRNPGTPNNDGYRACYFQFTLDAETVKALDTAASAKLRVYIPSIDSNIYRKLYDVVVHATKSGWNEPLRSRILPFCLHRRVHSGLSGCRHGDFLPVGADYRASDRKVRHSAP